MRRHLSLIICAATACAALTALPFEPNSARGAQKKKAAEEWKAPALPDNKAAVTDTSEAFVKIPAGVTLKQDVTVAKVAPGMSAQVELSADSWSLPVTVGDVPPSAPTCWTA